MSAPKQPGGFVQGSAIASASGGREELIGKHRSPFRDPLLKSVRGSTKNQRFARNTPSGCGVE